MLIRVLWVQLSALCTEDETEAAYIYYIFAKANLKNQPANQQTHTNLMFYPDYIILTQKISKKVNTT